MSRDNKPSLSGRLAKKALGRIYTSIEETVVPRTEDFIFDLFSSIVNGFSNLVIGAFEGLIYRDDDYDYVSRNKNYGRSSYHDYYDNRNRSRRRKDPSVVRKKDKEKNKDRDESTGFTEGLISCKNWNEIYYDNRRSAQMLVDRIKTDVVAFNGLSVSVLYEYLKKTGGDFTDTYYGWKNLDHARVQAIGPREYWVRLPEPDEID